MSSTSALSSDEFRDFKIVSVEPYNHNTSRFVFELPEGQESGLTVASAILTQSSSGEPDAARPYTPVSAPDQKGRIDLLIKRYEGGAVSSHIHSLSPGSTLSLKGPLPKFPYKSNEFTQIYLIGGGSGITPLWQILQRIHSDPSDKTKVHLIYSNISEEDILLREEFEKLEKERPEQFKVDFVLDKPPQGWQGPSGYVSKELLKAKLAGPETEKIKIFVCGPPGQMKAISGDKKSPKEQGPLSGALAELGYTAEQVYRF